MDTHPNSYGEKNSAKPGKIALKCMFGPGWGTRMQPTPPLPRLSWREADRGQRVAACAQPHPDEGLTLNTQGRSVVLLQASFEMKTCQEIPNAPLGRR